MASIEEIRDFMIRNKLGIDCSGLVAWTAHALVRRHTNRSLWRSIKYKGHPLRAAVIRHMRPVENLSARLLTDEINANVVRDLHSVKPGDIIRTLNGGHVLIITEVHHKQGAPSRFRYANSTQYDGTEYGVRYGAIDITKPQGHILDQTWVDGENGVNWIFKAANNFPDDTRIVRLKVLSDNNHN